jgi:hypothetical protein
MRNTYSWKQGIIKQLRPQWTHDASLSPQACCDVELGLYALLRLLPGEQANALWVLLMGYPFKLPQAAHWSEQERRMRQVLRYLLSHYKSNQGWRRAVDRYSRLPARLRLYDIQPDGRILSQADTISIGLNRERIYGQVLNQQVPFARDTVRMAGAGRYLCVGGKLTAEVILPEDLVRACAARSSRGHDLQIKQQRQPVNVTFQELLDTARWMDEETGLRQLPPASWYNRLKRVQLEMFDECGEKLSATTTLTWEGMLHLVGMVSSGKSTLMDVLAVWAARKGVRVTIVVGDVVSALNRAQLFVQLGIRAAPILGASNRERHTNRLHRILHAERPLRPLHQDHVGFRWLSTACALDGVRGSDQVFRLGRQPCLTLTAIKADRSSTAAAQGEGTEEEGTKLYACPLFPTCPYHQAQRDLVDADIWIATPASLIYSRVAQHLNPERLRFLELVYRRSDLLIVDEVDQVQVQLDLSFSPSQTLMARGSEAWLNNLLERMTPQLSQAGRGQLGDEEIDEWCHAHDTVQTAVNRLYAMLLKGKGLRKWIERDYFTDWLLFERIAGELSGVPQHTPPHQRAEHPVYAHLLHAFEEYLADPLGSTASPPLADFARQALTVADASRVQERITVWLHSQPALEGSADEWSEEALRIQFALIVAILANCLDFLIRRWKQVEEELKLEGGGTLLFHRPPEDYTALLPEAPMGNVLGFQYLRSTDDKDNPGDLRFFRCAGVGRWLLLHLHDLLIDEGIAGPNVLLLSGTSWAGGISPSYHVQAPVQGILRAPEEEITAIKASRFRFEPYYDEHQKPIIVSGKKGAPRDNALKELLSHLARPGGLGGLSRLEREKNALPEKRQRVLLLVGSYAEARTARMHLEQIRPDWIGQVLNLVPDDDEFESEWHGRGTVKRSLQRGMVHQLAETEAWILVAPLLAIERGHNILNEGNAAAIGAAFFLVRPHPRPDDIGHAIHEINRWAVERYPDAEQMARKRGKNQERAEAALTVDDIGRAFRNEAFKYWRHLLHLPVVYSSLPDAQRRAFLWNHLVVVWQVIGRLVRGGSPARIYFCDSAFARYTALQLEDHDTAPSSLIVGMQQILAPYFETDGPSQIPLQDRVIAQVLFGPMYEALSTIEGLNYARI